MAELQRKSEEAKTKEAEIRGESKANENNCGCRN